MVARRTSARQHAMHRWEFNYSRHLVEHTHAGRQVKRKHIKRSTMEQLRQRTNNNEPMSKWKSQPLCMGRRGQNDVCRFVACWTKWKQNANIVITISYFANLCACAASVAIRSFFRSLYSAVALAREVFFSLSSSFANSAPYFITRVTRSKIAHRAVSLHWMRTPMHCMRSENRLPLNKTPLNSL